MSRSLIKCLAYFDVVDSTENRMNNPASFAKSSYIFSCFERCGYDVEVLSSSYTIGSRFVKGSARKISDRVTLKTLSSFGRGCKIKNIISRILFTLNLLIHLLFFVKKGDTLWVYHSLGLIRCVTFLKKIKRFNLILEIEEIYSDVTGCDKTRNREKAFFKLANSYIFCTEYLSKAINTDNKPEVITHGTYKTEPDKKVSFKNNKKHVVYAGTFDPRKGGAMAAIGAAEFLDEDYHLHIIGFGSPKQIEDVENEISRVSKLSGCTVSYDGEYSGEEYKAFLQKCHVGLSTQNPDAAFNNTSFPSKILTYMANGLRVVSVRIPVVEASSVNELIYYYDKQIPEAVAMAIKSVDFNDNYDSREVLRQLDRKCLKEIEKLLI